MSEPVNGASEQSERSTAERCGASERSERCERTNVASDRVACSKRDCLRLETPSLSGREEQQSCEEKLQILTTGFSVNETWKTQINFFSFSIIISYFFSQKDGYTEFLYDELHGFVMYVCLSIFLSVYLLC